MEFAEKNREALIKGYKDGLSSYALAKELGTYSNKVRRALKYLGVTLRGYSEAQKQALESGRAVNPTEGKTLSDEVKAKISKNRAKAWANLSDEERDRVSQMSKDQWARMSDEEKHELRQKALLAVRETGTKGSRAEKFVFNKLKEEGYNPIFHTKDIIKSQTLEIDIFIPDIKTAVEIDGPSHFVPIWGEEKLKKQQKSDTAKQGLILSEGYAIIRVRQLDRNMTQFRLRATAEAVCEAANEIKNNFPKKGKRLIEVEVKDGQTRRI
jgi:very-short-patch-repair endonuclease